jgi:hypothetical protein
VDDGTANTQADSREYSNGDAAVVAVAAIPTTSSGFLLREPKGLEEIVDAPESPAKIRQDAHTPKPLCASPHLHTHNDKEGNKGKQLQSASPELVQKYDIRSARGGRGGKVTSVAAIWSSLAVQQEQTTKENPVKKRNAPVSRPAPLSKPRVLLPTVTEASQSTAVKVTASTARAKVNKGLSVPAVISSSLATPVLSSTASLARPISSNNSRKQLHTRTDAAQDSVASPLPTTPGKRPNRNFGNLPADNEFAFGQARLKDLIKKYQQGQ